MSHFAKIENGIVAQVIVAEQDFVDTLDGQWVQTSYNTRKGVHYGPDGQPDGGVALRGNYAGIGYVYDVENDVLYAPQPFPSWTLNRETWLWEPPVPYPNNDKFYIWDETIKNWVVS